MLWVSAAILVAGTLAALLWPLLRRPRLAEASGAYDVEVYRDQLAEVDRDRERGLIESAEAEAARAEIERRLLAVADGAAAPPPGAAGGRRRGAAALAILIPAAALGLYLEWGSPTLPGAPFAEADERRAETRAARQRGADTRIAALRQRLEKSPDDLASWIEIARTYRGVERYAETAEAFGRARELAGDMPIILSAYGEALTFAADGTVTPEARDAFEKVLEEEPGEARARYYMGVWRSQRGDPGGALKIWIALEATAPANTPWRASLLQAMQGLADASGIDLAALRKQSAGGSDSGSGPSAEDLRAARDMSPEERTEMIRGMVARLAARLEENPNDIEGWKKLGRSYRVLGESGNARKALARAKALEKAGAAGAGTDGSPDRSPDGSPDGSSGGSAAQSQAAQSQAIRGMVERLAARLVDSPDDLAGWKRLGRSYMVLGEPAKAVDAYARAAAMAPGDVPLLVDYGEAILTAQGGGGDALPDAFVTVMRDVLVLEGSQPLALWYVGLAESRAGRAGVARIQWRRLLAAIPADAPQRADVQKRIDALPTAAE